MPLPISERAGYTLTAEQTTPNDYHVRVADPTGRRFAQWWVVPIEREVHVPMITQDGRRVLERRTIADTFVLCSRPDLSGTIRRYPDFDRATRAANLRARQWLGSCWGLKGAARRLP